MSKATKRKSSSESKRRSSSIGEKKLSVFDRLGTKALPVEPPLCRHNIYHAYCPACRTSSNSQLPVTSLCSSVKRSAKKESDIRTSVERVSPDTDWADWDQSQLEYQDEKALERRRQQLQRELELQMSSDRDLSAKNNNSKKRSSSSCSTSSSSSLSSSSSSNSSTQKIESKKIVPSSPDRIPSANKKLSKMVYKETSPGRKLSKKSPGNKMYKKSVSPSLSHAASASTRKSPSKRLNSRKKGLDRDRSRQRSTSMSRERRRERSKEVRHRTRLPHMSQHSSHRSSERRKDEQRLRRDEVRRERRSDARDSRRDKGEEMRLRERCRERDSSRREKCSRGSHQNRSKDEGAAAVYSSSNRRSTPLSPATYHHHYRGERGRYGSSERERVSGYKELSPKEQETRIRLTHPPSSAPSNYAPESNRIRRRGAGWDGGGGRYDSPKCSRDWDSTSERIHEWQRGGGKHNQDKEFSSMDKQKDIVDWKRSGVTQHSGRDPDDSTQSKRARLDDPPPPPPPPIINEPDLSDISDDPDDILNRDDGEEVGEECGNRCQVVEEVSSVGSIKQEDSQPQSLTQTPLSTNLDQRLMHQRIADEEAMDSLDFEEISDEELEEESKNNKGCDALGVDWASFIAECHVDKSWSRCDASSGKPWETNNILRRIGVSRKFAGDTLFQSIQKQLTVDGGEGLQSDVGGIQSALMQRKKRLSISEWKKLAVSARTDLAFRRQLCGLPAVAIENYPLSQYQVA